MRNLYKKHHIASALHNLSAFMNEVSALVDEVDEKANHAGQTAVETSRQVTAMLQPTTETGTDILYPPEKCGVNIPWVEFGNDIVSKQEWGKLSLAADPSKAVIVEELFTVAKEEGFNTVRFWMFPSLWHNGGHYTDEMIVEAMASTHALCKAARAAGVQLVPTLLSFDNWSKEKVAHGGVAPYTSMTHNELLKEVIVSLDNNADVIDYVDIINEPEWSVTNIPNADPNPKMDATTSAMMRAIIQNVALMLKDTDLRYGFGSASLKWHDSNLLANADVVDYHAYEGWSTEYFPPAMVLANSNTYMGETDIPYSEWGTFFADDRYAKVFFWLESKDYTDREDNISTDVLRESLREFKGT